MRSGYPGPDAITFVGISFSVSLLIMQQGSTQFSPRVLHALRRDPFVRRVLAIVLATFTYCLVVSQRVRGPLIDGGDEVVPRFAVALGLVLGVAAVLAIVAAIHHTSRQMDVSQILGVIVDDPVGAQQQAPETALVPLEFVQWSSAEDASTIVCFKGDGWVRRSTGPRSSRQWPRVRPSDSRPTSAATPSGAPPCARCHRRSPRKRRPRRRHCVPRRASRTNAHD
jgi:hypothetical protein